MWVKLLSGSVIPMKPSYFASPKRAESRNGGSIFFMAHRVRKSKLCRITRDSRMMFADGVVDHRFANKSLLYGSPCLFWLLLKPRRTSLSRRYHAMKNVSAHRQATERPPSSLLVITGRGTQYKRRPLCGRLWLFASPLTDAAWLHDLLKPHVTRLVVCDPRKNALLKDGSKSDRIDARKLAELLRV